MIKFKKIFKEHHLSRDLWIILNFVQVKGLRSIWHKTDAQKKAADHIYKTVCDKRKEKECNKFKCTSGMPHGK